jgi:FSR family fosmidomycin resistance protein-like MFS transporter
LARQAAGRRAALALAIFSAGGTAGLAFGPLVIGFFITRGWLTFTPVLMVPGLLFGLLILLLLPPRSQEEHVRRGKLIDLALFKGPVGALCLAGVLRSMAWTAVLNGAPLWLVNAKGLSATSPVVFWTISVFTLSGAIGGILFGSLENRFSRQALVTGTMLMALLPLATLLLSRPGSLLYFVAVVLAGALANGGLPVMVLAAQDAAPHAVSAASGMMMGLTWGTAGVLYLGVGALQESLGMTAAMWLSVAPLLPGALIAFRVLRKLERSPA